MKNLLICTLATVLLYTVLGVGIAGPPDKKPDVDFYYRDFDQYLDGTAKLNVYAGLFKNVPIGNLAELCADLLERAKASGSSHALQNIPYVVAIAENDQGFKHSQRLDNLLLSLATHSEAKVRRGVALAIVGDARNKYRSEALKFMDDPAEEVREQAFGEMRRSWPDWYDVLKGYIASHRDVPAHKESVAAALEYTDTADKAKRGQ